MKPAAAEKKNKTTQKQCQLGNESGHLSRAFVLQPYTLTYVSRIPNE